jgi:hypothetical protein
VERAPPEAVKVAYAQKIDDHTCEFTNTVRSSFTPELLDFLASQGIPWEVIQAVRGQ